MKCVTNLFTEDTWQDFLDAGGDVVGFRRNRWRLVQKIVPGDLVICYLIGVKSFVGLLEVTGDPYRDDSRIWSGTAFPSRIPVRVLVQLEKDQRVPLVEIDEQLTFHEGDNGAENHFVNPPIPEKSVDAEVIVNALRHAHPTMKGEPVEVFNDDDVEEETTRLEEVINVMDDAPVAPPPVSTDYIPKIAPEANSAMHDQIQWFLMKLGSQMQMGVYIPAWARNRSSNGNVFSNLPGLQMNIPSQGNPTLDGLIAQVDVLWIKGDRIIAAFEIEADVAFHAGLLRLADLGLMQLDAGIRLYLVSPATMRDPLKQELSRPTFVSIDPSIKETTVYLAFNALDSKVQQLDQLGVLKYIQPEFMDEITESLD